MKKLSDFLILAFAIKCLVNFIQKEGTIGDGLFLISSVVYLFTKLDIATDDRNISTKKP